MEEVTEKRENGDRLLAPLIRAPNVTSRSPRSPPPDKKPLSRNVSSSFGGNSDPGHLKRREKLRTILAMMDRGSKRKTRLRDRDRETKEGNSRAWSILAAGVREGLDEADYPMMRGQHRRHAIPDGKVPIKSSWIDAERSTDDDPEPPIRLRKFGKLHTMAKIIVLLLRMCKTYILTENDANMVKLYSAIDAVQAGDKYKIRGDLLFDVTMYRAKKQNKISSETKRVLETPPSARTEKDIHHVQVELQQMEFITKYPVHMQRSLIRTGAFESYETGRVIIRHGRRPYGFYLVLGGSALALEGDPQNSGRPATALLKGRVFGHEAIVNRGRHNVTVISKEYIQLLSLTVEEYSRIFLAGGVSNISGVDGSSFIESIGIFKGWPRHLLKKHPNKCRFNFFTRGTVIEQDSNQSDWIYVLKSGSCAVLKKLHLEELVPAKRKRNLPSISPRAVATSHEEQLARKLRDIQRKRAKALKGKSRRLTDTRPKNIVRVPIRDDPLSTDPVNCHAPSTSVNHGSLPSVNQRGGVPAIVISDSSRPKSSSSPVQDACSEHGSDSPQSSPGGESTTDRATETVGETGSTPNSRKPGFSWGPFLTHTKRLPSINEGQQPQAKPKPEKERVMPSTVKHNNDKLPSHLSDAGYIQSRVEPRHSPTLHQCTYKQSSQTTSIGRDTFVQIDTLRRGAIFGVSDMAFGKQPSLCLVSNGAECILIAKKFYSKHATEANLKAIADLLRPYPTEDTLLRDLREKLTWRDHRDETLMDTARSLRRHRRKSVGNLGLRTPASLSMNTGP